MNTPSRPVLLALPEPKESVAQRVYGVEPWMLAETYEEFARAALAIGQVAAFEKFEQANEHTELLRFLWDWEVRQVERYSDGRIASDKMERAWRVFDYRRDQLARWIARDAVAALQKRRRARQWRRVQKEAAA
jgi:hypothetical protein